MVHVEDDQSNPWLTLSLTDPVEQSSGADALMAPPTLASMYDQANGDAESSLMDAGLQPEQEAPMQPEQEAPVVQPEAEQAPSEGGVDETASAMLDVPSESGASRGCTEPAAQDIASIHRQNDVQLSKPPHVHVSCPPSISDGPSQPAAQQAGQVEAEPMLSVLAAVVCAGAAASSVVAATSLELPATANDPSHAAGRGGASILVTELPRFRLHAFNFSQAFQKIDFQK